jgi:hypothetical protein
MLERSSKKLLLSTDFKHFCRGAGAEAAAGRGGEGGGGGGGGGGGEVFLKKLEWNALR